MPLASSMDLPIIFGTGLSPSLITKSMAVPLGALSRPFGDWLRTAPIFSPSTCLRVTLPTLKPASASCCSAFDSDMPVTSGTAFSSAPLQMVRIIRLPCLRFSPAFGDCSITVPGLNLSGSPYFSSSSTLNCFSSSSFCASTTVILVTLGTSISARLRLKIKCATSEIATTAAVIITISLV